MTNRERIKRTMIRPALIEVDHEVVGSGIEKGRASEWHLERYIWRTEDIPHYRVAVGEHLTNTLINKRGFEYIKTRFLEYIPTGRIMYDNSLPETEAVLFEYRLRDAREIRDVKKQSCAETHEEKK